MTEFHLTGLDTARYAEEKMATNIAVRRTSKLCNDETRQISSALREVFRQRPARWRETRLALCHGLSVSCLVGNLHLTCGEMRLPIPH
jgi:hypothetical protein